MMLLYLILTVFTLNGLTIGKSLDEIYTKVPVVEHEHVLEVFLDEKTNNVVSSSTTERTLIRVTRDNEQAIHPRSRRQLIEAIQTAGVVLGLAKAVEQTDSVNQDDETIGERILGMAKTIAISIVAIGACCFVCCCMTIVIICVKCCCKKTDRKSNQMERLRPVPQPIYIHTGPTGYNPPPWNASVAQSPEAHPMLIQPSAPVEPVDPFQNECPPPPYEKIHPMR